MINYTPIIISIIFAAAAIACLAICRRMLKGKRDVSVVGHLIVDPTDPEKGGGVYLQIEVDPRTFTDGDIVKLAVWKISQEEHGI